MFYSKDDSHVVNQLVSKISSELLQLKDQYATFYKFVAPNHISRFEQFLFYQAYQNHKVQLQAVHAKYGLQLNDPFSWFKLQFNKADVDTEKTIAAEGVSIHTSSIMVNIKRETLNGFQHLIPLIQEGVSQFRINCAFGTHAEWLQMINNVKQAGTFCGSDCKVLLDMAGPKIRIEAIYENGLSKADALLKVGRRILLGGKRSSGNIKGLYFQVDIPDLARLIKVGDPVRFDDSKVEAVVIDVDADCLILEVRKLITAETELTVGKGINFPTFTHAVDPLTSKDRSDLEFAVKYADVISFSFTHLPEDIDKFIAEIKKHTAELPPVVIKIETQTALNRLREILIWCYQIPNVTILIARGDLVSECGFERLAANQEYIFKLAKEAGLPVILATEVLEQMNQLGMPSRSEMIDAHYALDADQILLNAGSNAVQCAQMLKALKRRN